MMSEKRKTEEKKKNLKENAMSYEEFDWNEMLNDGTLAKQCVPILDKHIEKHNLLAVKSGKKPQKVNAIIDHLQSNKENALMRKNMILNMMNMNMILKMNMKRHYLRVSVTRTWC